MQPYDDEREKVKKKLLIINKNNRINATQTYLTDKITLNTKIISRSQRNPMNNKPYIIQIYFIILIFIIRF